MGCGCDACVVWETSVWSILFPDQTSRNFVFDGVELTTAAGELALGNVKRHAEASKVVIRLESRAGEIKMTIVDNGKGLAQTQVSDLSSAGKLAIMGMRERAQLLGGTLSIESELGKGTAVIVMIPLE